MCDWAGCRTQEPTIEVHRRLYMHRYYTIFFSKTLICDSSVYATGHPDLTTSDFMENAIGLLKGLKRLVELANSVDSNQSAPGSD